ncbi:MAG TPA: hypothetical protein VK803_02715 [Steroidobacteraceae bacterium]|nr:hypothetical protein [Steroidobacteraceae bacterium]
MHNSVAQGGTGLPYVVQSGAARSGALQYLDAPFKLALEVPRAVENQTLLQTAGADSSAAVGSTAFITFTVTRSSTVYVAYDAHAGSRPDWLTTNFLDTGQQLLATRADAVEPFELYANTYAANATVTLGANLAASAASRAAMYTVIVAPTPSDDVAPTPPQGLQRTCATAAVVGLRWTAATDNVAVMGYRIVRDAAVIATVSYAQTTYTDAAVSGNRRYSYVVVAFDGAGNIASSTPLRVRTAAAAANGDAPYCQSGAITAMTFDYRAAYSETNGNRADEPPYSDGSDLWPLAWGSDGNTYTVFGDGWGLCGQLDVEENARRDDYTSFGVATISGPMPPAARMPCPSQFIHGNIYGGYDSAQPYGRGKNGLINGKSGAIIVVGSTIYGLGATWRTGEAGGPQGAPTHAEMLYSTDMGRSWHDTPWNFCSADSAGNPDPNGGLQGGSGICPIGFVNFGPGNAGALDDYVYLYAVDNSPVHWVDGPAAPLPANSYLLRVRNDQLLIPTAYQYYAGLDSSGNPLWSELPSRRQAVFTDRALPRTYAAKGYPFPMAMNLEEAVYDAPLQRFIATAQGQKVGQLAFYESRRPWGPWSLIYYANINPARGGSGGWGNLGAGSWDGSRYAGADSLGVHIGNAWTSRDGKTLWLVFSSNQRAPQNTAFSRLAGNWMDSFNLVEARLAVR